MHTDALIAYVASLLTLVGVASAGFVPASTAGSDYLASKGLLNLAANQLLHWSPNDKCSLLNAQVRREWGTLLPSEQKAYTDAVNCLMKKPAKTNPALAPGAKTRYDDFVALHINQTLIIHNTANFLSWHRLFVWNYEQALQNECGYKGTQPYWNWGKTAFDPVNSPVFDGTPYSLGGNGDFIQHNCTDVGVACIPAGTGGGCVTKGPFKNYTVNLAPVSPAFPDPSLKPNGFLTYQPRCLRRDVSVWVSSQFNRDQDVVELITNKTDIASFQNHMQGDGFVNGFFGVHAGGHFTIGGDPGGDFFVSPGDPAFFVHHAQIDRVWWIWQNQDIAQRQNAIAGTITMNNSPPSRNGTLDDFQDMTVTGVSVKQGETMSTLGGPFCYIYL